MAVIKSIENSILSLKTQIGTLSNGKPKYKSYSYSNLDTAAEDGDLHYVAMQLSTLFAADIAKITRQDTANLVADN